MQRIKSSNNSRTIQLKLLCGNQARSQDLEKGGGGGGGAMLKQWEVCKRPWLEFSLTLNQFQTVCPKFETECLGNLKVFSAQN